ncbi:MAG: T9SS type A sorting domain-containing protein [Chitinophagales bacterium]
MKTLVPLLTALLLLNTFSFGQYCGNSGPGICTASGSLPPGKFTPNDSIPCIKRGEPVDITIQFSIYDTISFSGQILTIQSLKFDSIENLPQGLCWASNSATNSFPNMSSGCLHISGTTYAPAGQYKLSITCTMNIGIPITTNMDAAGLYIYLRVIEPSINTCPEVDTAQTAPYVAYAGATDSVSMITGKVYYDVNNNQIWDAGELGIANQAVSISLGANYTTLTNSQGNYYVYVPTGSFNVTPHISGPASGYPVNPQFHFVTVSGYGITSANNNFGVAVPSSFCNSSTSVYAVGAPPRPGFTNQVNITFTNQFSALPAAASLRLYYDAQQQVSSTSSGALLIDTVNHFIEWHFTNLMPGNYYSAYGIFNTPVATPLGTVFNYRGQISDVSCSSTDTSDVIEQLIVVGSYDPNDKSVSPVGDHNGTVPTNSTLRYTIRFQNTGTFMAETVKIMDTLSNYLDPTTLQVLAASHNYAVQIDGQKVRFTFANINLPDSFSNEPQSHGFIQFSVKPKSPVVPGSSFSNTGYIYFDFNPAVVTNSVATVLDNISGLSEPATAASLYVYPNPSHNGQWYFDAPEGLAGHELAVTDLAGKIVYQGITSKTNQLNLGYLQTGVYLLKLGDKVVRLVKD